MFRTVNKVVKHEKLFILFLLHIKFLFIFVNFRMLLVLQSVDPNND